jgi:hypothetical protein
MPSHKSNIHLHGALLRGTEIPREDSIDQKHLTPSTGYDNIYSYLEENSILLACDLHMWSSHLFPPTPKCRFAPLNRVVPFSMDTPHVTSLLVSSSFLSFVGVIRLTG